MRTRMLWQLILLALVVSAPAFAAIWTGNGSISDPNDNRWNVVANWNTGILPISGEDVYIDRVTRLQPLVDSTVIAVGGTARIGGTAGGGTTNQLTVTGGTVTLSGVCILGEGAGSKATLEVSGGSFQTNTFWVGNNGKGTVIITGGSINVMAQSLYVDRFNKASNVIYLYGGVIEQNGDIFMGSGGLVDITEGTLILNSDRRTTVNNYIAAGKIKAYGGASTVVVDYGTTNPGKTTVTAVVYRKAWKPSPAIGAVVEDLETDLSWRSGSGAVSHTIYFGTDQAAVASGSPSVLMGTQTENTFDPGLIASGQLYYWRVDESDGSTVHAGDVWSFSAIDPKQASSPNPANGATGVSNNPTLSWLAGAGAISHDVYFGESADNLLPASIGQATPSYAPGMLVKGKQYFWRVDENNGSQITTGVIWSFTVVAGASSTTWTNNDPNSELWSSEMNWNNGTPGLTTDINLNSEPNIVIDDSVVAVCKVARISVVNPADANLPSIFMTGGKLNVSSDFVLGQNAGSKPVMEISGGIANIYSCWTGNMDNSGMGSSRLCITGGTLTCNYLWVSRFSPSTGQPDAIQLDGGTISTGQFNMGQGYMDITAGTLIINGDVTSQIDTYISNGWLTAYNGTGVFIVDYNNLNLGKTTVKACASGFETDFNGDCLVDITDLSMMVSDWLFKTPSDISWAFDMSTDPVGSGTYDLKLRDTTNIHYNMTDWPGTLAVSGDLLLDEQVPSSGLWDADLQYVVKSVTEAPLNLWVTMGTSANPGKKAYVGVSTKLDSGTNTQTVEIWTGNPPHVTPYSPVVATGFASNAFIAITVNYDYATDTYDWSASDGVLNQSGTNVAYSYFNDGNGGSFTIQGTGGAMGYIDALSFTIAGSDWYSVYDLQPDGSVDLIDFAVMASEWLN